MDVETELRNIQQRNQRVEQDKAWEVSLTRRSFIVAVTYILAVLFLWSIGNSRPILTALIPAIGYFISTLTLPIIRKFWETHP